MTGVLAAGTPAQAELSCNATRRAGMRWGMGVAEVVRFALFTVNADKRHAPQTYLLEQRGI